MENISLAELQLYFRKHEKIQPLKIMLQVRQPWSIRVETNNRIWSLTRQEMGGINEMGGMHMNYKVMRPTWLQPSHFMRNCPQPWVCLNCRETRHWAQKCPYKQERLSNIPSRMTRTPRSPRSRSPTNIPVNHVTECSGSPRFRVFWFGCSFERLS